MIDRRTFSAALAGTLAMPGTLWGQKTKANAVFYANIGPDLTLYDIDVDAGTLARRSTHRSRLRRADRAWRTRGLDGWETETKQASDSHPARLEPGRFKS